jgi:multidrug efflux system membrane fusion protein
MQGRLALVMAGVLVVAGVAGGVAWWRFKPAGEPAVVAAGGTSAAGQRPDAAGRRPGGGRAQPVLVAQATSRDMTVVVSAIGNLAALNTAVVRAKVGGELKALHFKEGQQVRAGQLLAEIDGQALTVQLSQAQGQLQRDQAQLRNAELDLTRYKDLLAKDAIASQQVDTQDALVRQLRGTVLTDQAQVDSAKLQLSYTHVTAPISGRLGLKQADLGSMVSTTDVNGLVSITQTQPMALVFAVPEAQLPRIRQRLGDHAALPVEVWDRDARQRLGQGRVTTTDNAIDATTGTIKIKAEFPNADGSLFPNQFVNVRLQVDQQKGVLAVPGAAVQRGTQGTFVYVVKDDSTVSIRRIRLGDADGDWVGVQGDLAPGDRVVTDGADRLREGAAVEVVVPPAGKPGQGGKGSAGEKGGQGWQGKRPAADAPNAPVTPAATATSPSVASGPAAPARAPSPAVASTTPPASASDAPPPWFDRLPPEVQERYKKMNPDERRDFIEKLRERRRQREAEGG